MTSKTFTVGEAMGSGWQAFKNNVGFAIGVFVIMMLLSFLQSGTQIALMSVFGENSPLPAIVPLLFFPIGIILSLGLFNVWLKLIDGQKGKLSDLYSMYPLFWRYVGSSILVGLATLIGILLFIIPGLIISLRLQFYGYYLIDQNAGVVEAMQRSWNDTRGLTGKLFLFALAEFAVMILGVLLLLIGVFAAAPVIALAQAYIYRKLVPQDGMASMVESPALT